MDSGLYLLIVKMDARVSAKIGALGSITFSRGYYAYCGSARKSLSRRLSRHIARRKKLRWHIDYLTCLSYVRIVSTRTVPLNLITECQLNSLIQELPGAAPIRGFGCSDCRCVSHLTFFGDTLPDLRLELNRPA